MSFLTEDPDTVNAIIAEEEREANDISTVLHDIRTLEANPLARTNGSKPSIAQPYGTDDTAKWDRDMHPKD